MPTITSSVLTRDFYSYSDGMGSRGRIPPPHLRRPLPGSAILPPDPFGPGVRPPAPGPFPPFDILPPPEVMEQKLAVQHMEMQKLSTENQRLAATHRTLRQELAAAQHELQILHAHIGVAKSEREQHMRGLLDKIAKMEGELKSAETVRLELQQARAEAESLAAARQELVSKVQKLNQELHKAHTDTQQIPALMLELEGLRQEFQRCRVSFEYEKKLFSDHLESLQVMEKNYVAMAGEVEKLRSQLSNTANADTRTGYGVASGNNDSGASSRAAVQNTYGPSYGVHQGQGLVGLPANPVASSANATGAAASLGPGTGTPTYFGSQAGSVPRPSYDPSRAPAYDPSRAPAYDPSRASAYDPSRVPTYDPSRGLGYDLQRAPGYDSQMGTVYSAQGGHAYDMQRGAVYDAQRVPSYDAQRQSTYDTQRGPGVQQGISYDAAGVTSFNAVSRGAAMSQGQVPPTANMPYGSTTPPAHAVSVYQAPPQGGNSVRK